MSARARPRGGIHRIACAACLGLAACTAGSPAAAPTPSPSATPAPAPTPTPSPTPRARFDVDNVMEVVRELSVEIGPREASSAAYRTAAQFVERRFEAAGYDVRRQRLPVPAGSWQGYALGSGTTVNVIAEPPGFDPARPHLVVGGHLDTVPPAPGAYDNASGIGIVIELARMFSIEGSPTPIVFVAFGAEERRRPGEGGHHYGSLAYVDALGKRARRGLHTMLSIDAVAEPLQLCGGDRGSRALLRALQARAERLELDTRPCLPYVFNWSDHWSFQLAGFGGAWLWGGPTPETHTSRDRIGTVRARELRSIGLLAWETLRRFRVS